MSENSNQLIFLGTGTSQGVPFIGCKHPVCLSTNPKDKRLRASVMVHYHGKHILIDCGPDFRQQMLREDLSMVDAILVTHEHNDHIIGLDDVRPINFATKKNMPIYGMPRVVKTIKERFPYAFATNKYPGAPSFKLNEIKEEKFDVEGITVTKLDVLHGDLPILGYRIGNMAYITDIKTIPTDTMKSLENLDILVIDALRQKDEHYSHLTLDEALQYAKQIGAKQTYFTHMNQHMGFHDEVNKNLPSNTQLAYDGLRVSFS